MNVQNSNHFFTYLAAAILLPIIGLGGTWIKTHYDSLQGVEWDIPVRGYDPRDFLRGHYVEYEYDWPGVINDRNLRNNLCIIGRAPIITEVLVDGKTDKCVSVVSTDTWGVYGEDNVSRGRLYIPQTQGKELDKKLADRKLRGIIRARIRDDGTILPLSINFVPNLVVDEEGSDDGPEAFPQ